MERGARESRTLRCLQNAEGCRRRLAGGEGGSNARCLPKEELKPWLNTPVGTKSPVISACGLRD